MGKFGFGIASAGGAAITAVLLAACGGGSSGNDAFTGDPDNGDNGGDPTTSVGNIFITGDNELTTGADGELELRVVVVDGANRVMSGVEVIPQVDDRAIVVGGDRQTDDGGRAILTLSSDGSASNRSLDFRVAAGDATSSIFPIDVVGTRWVRQSRSLSGNGGELNLLLEDGSGGRISGSTVSSDRDDNVVLSPEEGQTGLQGEYSVVFEATGGAGDYRFDVTSSGASFSQFWSVADQSLRFLEPAGETLWGINEDQTIRVSLTDASGDPLDGETIVFRATRGELERQTVDTVNGEASVTLRSSNVGPALITAEYAIPGAAGETVETNARALFVTDVIDNISVQAVPSTIGVGETSQIIATVRDPEGQPVQGATVDFNIKADDSFGQLLGSAATTDIFGRAEVIYEGGNASSSADGVRIEAKATEEDIANDVTLTVIADALFITLGTGNELVDVDSTTYAQPYTAVVTDSAGNPVTNRDLSLALRSTDYRRGRWEPGSTTWVQNVTWECPTEDPDNTGDINQGNDVSDTGSLLPGAVASIVVGGTEDGDDARVRTDENGFVNFEIRYPKDHAQWVRVQLTGSIEVDGTEGRRSRSFWLPIADDDVSLDTVPPGQVSPYGTGAPDATNGCVAFDGAGDDDDISWQRDQLPDPDL